MTEIIDEPDHSSYVWILGLESDEDSSGDRGRFFRPEEARMGRSRVPAQLLRENVGAFVSSIGLALRDVPPALAGYSIDSIEISLEISASGSVSLLGSGGELAGKGGIVFKLARQKAANSQRRSDALKGDVTDIEG
jgi:hypothetical protein